MAEYGRMVASPKGIGEVIDANSTANRLTREDQQALSRLISLHQTGGVSESATVDKDFLLEDGNFDLFFLNYFPNDFQTFEPFNYKLMEFLEHESQGMAWCPVGSEKYNAVALHGLYHVPRAAD
jgi:hypothetical protein